MLDWLNDYSGILNIIIAFLGLITSIITAGLFVGILGFTWWYSKSTKDIAKRTMESVEITKDKERIDRTLSLIDGFDIPGMDELWHKKYHHDKKGEEIIDEVIPFLKYMDTSFLLRDKGKLDEDLFESKLLNYFLTFCTGFSEEIKSLLDPKRYLDREVYKYDYFVKFLREFSKKYPDKAKRYSVFSIIE